MRLARIGGALSLALFTYVAVGTGEPRRDVSLDQSVTAVSIPTDRTHIGPFKLSGAWRLDSPHYHFHGLSGLALMPDDRFLAVSDRGWRATFPKPGKHGAVSIVPTQIDSMSVNDSKDMEGVAVDPETGVSWIVFEHLNAIGRFEPGAQMGKSVRPAAMASWPRNTGPETIVRLTDGRFIVISEKRSRGRTPGHMSLLFESDPVGKAAPNDDQPIIFHLAMPNDFRPVDATQIPDGRVLILGRKFNLIFGFSTSIAIARPEEIRPNGLWQSREIARLDSGPLTDNYEGIASEALPGGGTRVWVVSDDNLSTVLQQQYLLRLDWQSGTQAKDAR